MHQSAANTKTEPVRKTETHRMTLTKPKANNKAPDTNANSQTQR